MKLKTLLILTIIGLLNISHSINAQEAGKVKTTLEFGVVTGPNLGALLAIEPKYNLTAKSSLGLRLELPGFAGRDVEFTDPNIGFTDGDTSYGGLFIGATYDRYLGKTGKSFQPFIGAGLGYFSMSGDVNILSRDDLEVLATSNTSGNIGALLRIGFDWGKFRYSLAYTYIPPTDLKLESGQKIGETRDNYFNFTLGYTIGGGKWKEQ